MLPRSGAVPASRTTCYARASGPLAAAVRRDEDAADQPAQRTKCAPTVVCLATDVMIPTSSPPAAAHLRPTMQAPRRTACRCSCETLKDILLHNTDILRFAV